MDFKKKKSKKYTVFNLADKFFFSLANLICSFVNFLSLSKTNFKSVRDDSLFLFAWMWGFILNRGLTSSYSITSGFPTASGNVQVPARDGARGRLSWLFSPVCREETFFHIWVGVFETIQSPVALQVPFAQRTCFPSTTISACYKAVFLLILLIAICNVLKPSVMSECK